MKIVINNFQKFIGRKDIKNPRYFMMEANFLTNSDYFKKLNKDAIVVFLYCVSEAIQRNSSEIDINLQHTELYTYCSEKEILDALYKLNELNILQTPINESVRDPYASVRDPYVSVQNPYADRTRIEENRKGGVGEKHDTLYPKEILGIAEILKARSVSNSLATKWVSLYDPRKICREVEKAESWLLAGKRTKKNYGLFFNNWLSRSEKSNSPSPEKKSDESRSTQVETKKSWYALEMEKKQKGLPNCLDGSQKSEVEIAQEKEFGSSGV